MLIRWWKAHRINERRWNLRQDGAMRLAVLAFALLVGGQVAFWSYSREVMPEMGIVPDVPGERTVNALSLGDDEAFFRILALNIQNSGDTFGRFTALYKYDYNKLYHWFRLLDGLNNRSNYVPALATYYFSQTQNPNDVRYLVDYLAEYTSGRVKEKWWWVVQGVYLAQHKLRDFDQALRLANTLRGVRGIPIWAQQMPAFIMEKRGEFDDARVIIEDILDHPEDYSQGELNFMLYFAKERMHQYKEMQAKFEQAQREKDRLKAEGVPEPEPMGPPSDVGAARAPGMPATP